jgi:hypothetical protein
LHPFPAVPEERRSQARLGSRRLIRDIAELRQQSGVILRRLDELARQNNLVQERSQRRREPKKLR